MRTYQAPAQRGVTWALLTVLVLAGSALAGNGEFPVPAGDGSRLLWPLGLFVACVLLGMVAVLGGVGGGVLFVAAAGALFPFHLDFVRAAGLMIALCGSLSAGPRLLKSGLASLRLAIPLGLFTSAGAVAGAWIGLNLPTRALQVGLGVMILVIAGIMGLSRRSSSGDEACAPDPISEALDLQGLHIEESTGEQTVWQARRTVKALAVFLLIGLIAGMFGLGAGWANVPALNLLMGIPIKVATATSNFMLGPSSAAAVWVYIHSGAVIPMMVGPAVLGAMLGARAGSRMLVRARPAAVRYVVIVMLAVSGCLSLWRGLK